MSATCPHFGFEVRLAARAGVSRESFAALRSGFLADVVAANDLVHTGGGEPSAVYTLSREGTQATDLDRELVRAWGSAHASDVIVEIGPLVDLDA